jgi:hypothetical protein
MPMNWKGLIIATGIASCAAFAANSAVLITDTFNDGSTSQLNWSGDSMFTSISNYTGGVGTQSTDYVSASNPYGVTCFTSIDGCVDMDGSQVPGSAVPAGVLQSNMALSAGAYTLTFEMSGNQRGGAAQTLSVDVGGSQVWTSGAVASSAPWTLETVHFTTAGGHIDFIESPQNDDMGNLIDNIRLFTGNQVPEPMTWSLMLVGVAGLGGMLRRRARLATA